MFVQNLEVSTGGKRATGRRRVDAAEQSLGTSDHQHWLIKIILRQQNIAIQFRNDRTIDRQIGRAPF